MTNINKSIRRVIKIIENYRRSLIGQDCNFWACDGTPENNRIMSMITCSRCQAIILAGREIRKLEKESINII